MEVLNATQSKQRREQKVTWLQAPAAGEIPVSSFAMTDPTMPSSDAKEPL